MDVLPKTVMYSKRLRKTFQQILSAQRAFFLPMKCEAKMQEKTSGACHTTISTDQYMFNKDKRPRSCKRHSSCLTNDKTTDENATNICCDSPPLPAFLFQYPTVWEIVSRAQNCRHAHHYVDTYGNAAQRHTCCVQHQRTGCQ